MLSSMQYPPRRFEFAVPAAQFASRLRAASQDFSCLARQRREAYGITKNPRNVASQYLRFPNDSFKSVKSVSAR